MYKDPYNHPAKESNRDFEQSWKRAAGWALEKIFVEHYQDHLLEKGIIMDIYPRKEKQELLRDMKLNFKVEAAKADILLVDVSHNSEDCFGVVHVKSSIAERRQNDQNFSQELMKKNYFSPFLTMDCKSFPSANPKNKGEFGEVLTENKDKRNDKRKEIEEEGYFSGCFSYNKNTKPTPEGQKATSRFFGSVN